MRSVDDLLTVPLFLPVLALGAVLAMSIGDRVGNWLRVSRMHGAAIVFSAGIIVSATLTPQWAALLHGALGPSTCDLSRTWLAPIRVYLGPGDPGGNVLMFVPLGIVLGLLPSGRRRTFTIAAAFLIPVVVEATQLMVRILDRACESADIVDNLTGLVIGLTLGIVGSWLLARLRSD